MLPVNTMFLPLTQTFGLVSSLPHLQDLHDRRLFHQGKKFAIVFSLCNPQPFFIFKDVSFSLKGR